MNENLFYKKYFWGANEKFIKQGIFLLKIYARMEYESLCEAF